MKTKKELNQKMWFRTLKSLYLLLFLLSIAGIIGSQYVPYSLDVSSSFVTCSDGVKIYGDDLSNNYKIEMNKYTLMFNDSDLAKIDGICQLKMKDPVTGMSREDQLHTILNK